MSVVVNNSKNVAGVLTPTKVTLATSGDTMTYVGGSELILKNTSGSDVVVTIDGSLGTTVTVPNSGGATFSVASGLAVTVPANGYQVVFLDKVQAYLQGTIAISAATGAVVEAVILY